MKISIFHSFYLLLKGSKAGYRDCVFVQYDKGAYVIMYNYMDINKKIIWSENYQQKKKYA